MMLTRAVPAARLPVAAQTTRRRSSAVVLAMPVLLALLLRVLQLTRPGFLLGVTEYDDGVYLGETLRWIGGALPYRDFAVVHPPAILILLTPIALFHHVLGADGAMAMARLATALVDVANVLLVGWLLRHRGRAAQVTGMTFLAVYPACLTAAHTLLLEPWLNLFCLLGALALFDDGRIVASRRRVLLGGCFFGFAGSIKVFAVMPALVVLVVLAVRHRRQLAEFMLSCSTGFLLPAAPFLLMAPASFVHEVVTTQLVRSASVRTPAWARLTYLDGMTSALSGLGISNPSSGLVILGLMILGFAFFVGLVLLLRANLRHVDGSFDDLSVYATGSAALVVVTLWWTASFWYHYAAFFGPFVAVLLGMTIPPAIASRRRQKRAARGLIAVAAVVAVIETAAIWRTSASSPAALTRLLPPGSCVFADEASFLVSTNTFREVSRGCPPQVDSDGATLSWDGGIAAPDLIGASAEGATVARWEALFSRTDYLVLSSGVSGSIPMTSALRRYLAQHFVVLAELSDGVGTVYRQVGRAQLGTGP